MKSIQSKFIVLFLICLFFSSGLIGVVSILYTKEIAYKEAFLSMQLFGRYHALEINSLLLHTEQSLDMLSEYAVEHFQAFPKTAVQHDVLNKHNQEIKDLALHTLKTTEGISSIYLRYNPIISQENKGFFWKKNSSADIEEQPLTDLSGYLVGESEDITWFTLPVQEGKNLWIPPYNKRGTTVITIARPLYKKGKLFGVIGFDIDFSFITKFIKNITLYNSGYAFLTDKNANILYHNFLQPDTDSQSIQAQLKNNISKHDTLENPPQDLLQFTFAEHDRSVVINKLHNDMFLMIAVPNAEIEQQANILAVRIIIIFLTTIIIAIIATAIAIQRILRPLQSLTAYAKEIAEGNFHANLHNHDNIDEVGILSSSLQKTVEQLNAYINHIDLLLYHDTLTGAENKTALLKREAEIEEKILKKNIRFAVIVFDLNNLKPVNDTYGHECGDTIIVNTFTVLQHTFPDTSIYRAGGDEFITIIEDIEHHQYEELKDSIERNIDEYNRSQPPRLRISLAFGISFYNAKTDFTFSTVFKRADAAMYRHKASTKEDVDK